MTVWCDYHSHISSLSVTVYVHGSELFLLQWHYWKVVAYFSCQAKVNHKSPPEARSKMHDHLEWRPAAFVLNRSGKVVVSSSWRLGIYSFSSASAFPGIQLSAVFNVMSLALRRDTQRLREVHDIPPR